MLLSRTQLGRLSQANEAINRVLAPHCLYHHVAERRVLPCDKTVGFLSVLLLASNYFFGFGEYCRLINGGQLAIIQKKLAVSIYLLNTNSRLVIDDVVPRITKWPVPMTRWIADREISLGARTEDTDLAGTAQSAGAALHGHLEHFLRFQPRLEIWFRDML